MMDLAEIIEKIKGYFERRADIIVAYLFGSATQNGNFSDVDIGILLDKKKKDFYRIESEISSDISLLVSGIKPDVSVLNDCPLFLKHEVIKANRIIFERSEEERCDFEVRSELGYYDFEPTRRFFIQCMRERIREGRFGGK